MKFTIVVCTYNSEKYLGKCLTSLATQSFKDFEVVAVDGYSGDSTLKILNSFSNLLSLRIYRQKPKGISVAMNLGLKKAKGELIIYLHSDDSFASRIVLSSINRWWNNQQLDWAYGKIKVIDESDKAVGIFPERNIWKLANVQILKLFNYIPHQAVVMRRAVLETNGGFDERLKIKMDYDLWLRISKNTNYRFMDILVSNFRIHGGATSSSNINRQKGQRFLKFVQKRHLNGLEYSIARLTNFISESVNRLYR